MATMKLERVWSESADAVFPTVNNFILVSYLQTDLQWELSKGADQQNVGTAQELHQAAGAMAAPGGIYQSTQYVNLVANRFEAYEPDDLAELNADVPKRDIFVATYHRYG